MPNRCSSQTQMLRVSDKSTVGCRFPDVLSSRACCTVSARGIHLGGFPFMVRGRVGQLEVLGGCRDDVEWHSQIWRTGWREEGFASLFILMEKITFVRNFGLYSLNKMRKIGNERSSLKAVLQNLNLSKSESYHFNASSSFCLFIYTINVEWFVRLSLKTSHCRKGKKNLFYLLPLIFL